MNKNKFWSIIMMFIITFNTTLVISSCGDDDDEIKKEEVQKEEDKKEEASTLNVDTHDITLKADGGSESFSIKSNTGWTVTGNSGWLIVEPSTGSGNRGIVVKAGENTSTSPRNCTLTIKTDDGSCSETVKVNQDASKTVLLVNGTREATLNFGADGNETQQINITANSDWKIINIPDWLQVSPSNGSGNSTIQIKTVSENFSDDDRLCSINIEGNDASAKIGINQTAKLAKNTRVTMSNLTLMSDGFACDLQFGKEAKGYREAFYTEGVETAGYTDRDYYNKLMKESEYSGVLDWTYLPGWVNPGTTIIYCVAAYGNENNPDGSHKYGPMLIKRITTPQKTIYDDMTLSMTYTSTRWSVSTSRSGNYGQRCDEYYIWANEGEYADRDYDYTRMYTYAFFAHFYLKPKINANPNNGYKSQPQTMNFERSTDKFFMACWGIDRDTKNFSAELTTIYKNLETDGSKQRIRTSPSTWNQKRHIVTKEEVEQLRKSMKVYRVQNNE